MSDDPILSALARLEAGQADTSSRLVRLDLGLSGLDAKMDAEFERTGASIATLETRLEAGQAGLRTEMAAFRTGVMDELGKTRGAIMQKVEGLQDSLTAIHADIAVNFGAVDQTAKRSDGI